MSYPVMKFTMPASQRAITRILALLAERPATTREVAAAIPADRRHAGNYLRHLRDQQAVHIGKWTREGTNGRRAYLRALWVAGPGKDAKRPPPKTKAQSAAEYRLRMQKEDPIAWTLKRRWERLKKKPVKADPASAWIRRAA